MSLRENVDDQLTDLIGKGHLPTSIRTSDADGVQIRLDVSAIDSMSVEILELELFLPKLRNCPFDVVKKWANELSTRVSYLLEAIGPLEFDEASGQALMRSHPPHSSNGSKEFYEVLLSSVGNGTFTLKRFASQMGQAGREQVPMQLTRQVILRLVDDLLASVPRIR